MHVIFLEAVGLTLRCIVIPVHVDIESEHVYTYVIIIHDSTTGVCVCAAVMRVQGSLRVVLNTMIWPNMLVERSSKRSVRISAIDADDGIKIYLIQVSHCSYYSSSGLRQKRDGCEKWHCCNWPQPSSVVFKRLLRVK